jgi:hypothetical protein
MGMGNIHINGRHHLGDLGVEGRMRTGFKWLSTSTVVFCCDKDNEPLSSTEGRKLLDYELF